MDFLNHLPEQVPQTTLLVSFDVVSLYSNIPHDLGLEAIRFWLENYPDDIHRRFTKDFMLDGINFILKNNTFYFNGKFYRQKIGTAMGTKFAPVYATLVMGYLEEKLYIKVAAKFGEQFKEYFIKYWNRFLDDCFVPWTRSENDLHTLQDMLNNLHRDISFTMEFSHSQLPFLDVLVLKNGTHITTDIYYKPTDSKLYLTFYSCHPKHIKTSIPFSLARRLRMIVTNDNILAQRLAELKTALLRQHYPNTIIDTGIEKALSISKADLRRVREKSDENVVTYVSTFNPKNPEMFRAIHENMDILYEDDRMRNIRQNQDYKK